MAETAGGTEKAKNGKNWVDGGGWTVNRAPGNAFECCGCGWMLHSQKAGPITC